MSCDHGCAHAGLVAGGLCSRWDEVATGEWFQVRQKADNLAGEHWSKEKKKLQQQARRVRRKTKEKGG